MSRLLSVLAVISLSPLFSCEENACCDLPDISDSLIGNWQVFEYGYSPGSGYIVEDVDADPPQILSFSTNNRFVSNYPGLEKFTYFLVLEDLQEGEILALFDEKPNDINSLDTHSLQHSYIIDTEDQITRLYFRYCIEGCHIGVERISD